MAADADRRHRRSQRLPGYTIAIEFRDETWFSERHRTTTLAFEKEHQFCNVVVDEPQVQGSIPTVWEVTDPALAMFRLHGRNRQMWNQRALKSAAERFDYLHTEKELRQFVPHVRSLAKEAESVHVVFNVNNGAKGVRGAQAMEWLLGETAQAPSPKAKPTRQRSSAPNM